MLLRAPEVILGAPWGPPADIWSPGAVLLEVLDAVRMFDGRTKESGGVYQTKHHLEEMEDLFGPFPSHLLAQSDQMIVAEYFDEHGKVRDPVSGRLLFWRTGLRVYTVMTRKSFLCC